MELLTTSTILSRVGFCEDCQKNKNPQTGQRFMVIGSTGKYHVYQVEYLLKWYGFTPHFYRIVKVIGENVVYERLCGMDKCGIDLYDNEEEKCVDYYFNKDKWIRGITTIPNWNSLVKFKDTGFKI